MAQGLLPTVINYATGGAGGNKLAIGAMADSYYEYLLKVHACLQLLDCSFMRVREPGTVDSKQYIHEGVSAW